MGAGDKGWASVREQEGWAAQHFGLFFPSHQPRPRATRPTSGFLHSFLYSCIASQYCFLYCTLGGSRLNVLHFNSLLVPSQSLHCLVLIYKHFFGALILCSGTIYLSGTLVLFICLVIWYYFCLVLCLVLFRSAVLCLVLFQFTILLRSAMVLCLVLFRSAVQGAGL